MCQLKEKGGRRCPTHQPASIALKKYIQHHMSMHPEHVEHAFRQLREISDTAEPTTQEQYQAVIQNIRNKAEKSKKLDDRTRTQIARQLNKPLSDSELPDPNTLYALQHLEQRSRTQKRRLNRLIGQIAETKGITTQEALDSYQRTRASMDNTYVTNLSDDYDGRTQAIADKLLSRSQELPDGTPEFSTPTNVMHATPNSRFIQRVAWNPDNGHLEVVMNSGTYAYRDVTQEEFEAVSASGGRGFNDHIRGNPDHAYESPEEAEKHALGRYCPTCREHRAMSHYCREPEVAGEGQYMSGREERSTERYLASEREYEAHERLQQRLKSQEAEADEAGQRKMEPLRERVRPENPKITNLNESIAYRPSKRNRMSRLLATRLSEDESAVAQFDLAQSPRSIDGKVGIVSQAYEAYRDGDEVVMASRGEPRCSCAVYQRNKMCQHLRHNGNGINEDFARNDDDAFARRRAASRFKQEAAVLKRSTEMSMFGKASAPMTVRVGVNTSGTLTLANGITATGAPTTEKWKKAHEALSAGGSAEVGLIGFRQGEEGEESTATYVTAFVEREGDDISVTNTHTCSASPCRLHDQQIEEYVRRGLRGEFDGAERASRSKGPGLAGGPKGSDIADSAYRDAWTTDSVESERFEATFEEKASPEDSYGTNIDKYLEDVKQARKDRRAREKGDKSIPVPLVMENALNGMCAPGSGRGFGVEIEYEMPEEVDSDAREFAMQKIARELEENGLSDIGEVTGYHRYEGNRWHIERDASVAGEVVSPVLDDSPESWKEIEMVCDIIKRNGGKTSSSTGGHVHMGIAQGAPYEMEERKAAVVQVHAAFQDSVRRMNTSYERKKHRGAAYARPMSKETAQDYIYASKRDGGYFLRDFSRNSTLNVTHPGRVEFRGGDGSLDPVEIQRNVMIAAGVVRAAERGEVPGDNPHHSAVGSNAKYVKALNKGRVKLLTDDDEVTASDVELRRFSDTCLNYEHGRRMVAATAANTPWQE